MFRGTGTWRHASSLSRVDLPMPLGPTRPYLRPCEIRREALLSSSLPRAETEKFSRTMSLTLSSTAPSPSAPPPADPGTRAPMTTEKASRSSRSASCLAASAAAAAMASRLSFFLASFWVGPAAEARSTVARAGLGLVATAARSASSSSSSEGGRSMSAR
uniref:Uncharacterized protein n=1 Tax=Arundo donax TaxID=35708 RepID=A0A0A9GCY2_ARUDO